MSPLEQLFDAKGPLSRAAPGYRYRPGQVRLAQAIQETLDTRRVLVAEAGTGVGKTFAYLVPMLQSQGKSLVSTATRHLQDQLYKRDIPRIKSALGLSAQIAVLKGRSNYLCLYRMEMHQDSGRFYRREDVQAFQEVVRFSSTTTTGDIAECVAVPESSPVWSFATSTRENCLGQNCPKLNDCHVMSARKKAAEADLVVVNHHLLCADMALRDEGFGELLPTVDYVVIDEAHALPEIATTFFSQSVSTQLLGLLARDALASGLQHARDGASWPDVCGAVEKSAADLRLLMPADLSRRMGWDTLSSEQRAQWLEKISAAIASVRGLLAVLEINAPRHIDLAQCEARAQDIVDRLTDFCEPQADSPMVRWMESSKYAINLHTTPYDIREKFQQELAKHQRAWIMVSATLAIGATSSRADDADPQLRRAFHYFLDRLGLDDATTLIAESPFDFQQQGMLLVPQDGPDPKASDLVVQLLNNPKISGLIEQAAGGVFVLCTSHRAVGLAKTWFEHWGADHPDRLLLVQGESPRHQMIDRFRDHGHAILIGSHSFWEGVDVPGNALSMVLIDKLPFAPPDDPILEARSRWLTQQGRDPFSTIQIPEAAILLKQGVGRLIRTETDRGLVIIGDRRLADTAYGRRILRSLPNFSRTRDSDEAGRWLSAQTVD
jgi:ATP-dependent DNA helicase DinG